MTASKESVLQALSEIQAPGNQGNIVSLDLVKDLMVNDGQVIFSITVPAEIAEKLEPLRKDAEKAVAALPGVEKVIAVLTAERKRGTSSAAAQKPAPANTAPKPESGLDKVKHVIAVASGKGGVGKSTSAVNIAVALAKTGLRVGILDADIYGPSLPRLLGITGKPHTDGKILVPMDAHGLKAMSIGFLIEEDTPMVWRGPMVISALNQMMRDVMWGELDILVADMPPGTGDVQLSMAQHVPLAGAVIISTPQDLALIDARKGLAMFNKVEVPILGIVENMSTFICPKCGEETGIFGHGGARKEAEKMDVPFLGEVPLHMDIRTNSDAGTPVTIQDPDGPHAKIYQSIAERISASLEMETAASAESAPAIVIE